MQHSIHKIMKRRGFVAKRLECVQLAGAIASCSTVAAVGWCMPEKREQSSTHSTRFARLRCVSFALLSLLSLAPLSQAQTNRPSSGTVVSWGGPLSFPIWKRTSGSRRLRREVLTPWP